METYMFEIWYVKRKFFKSKIFNSYKQMIRECEIKCKELHAKVEDVKICFIDENKYMFVRNPEHGELAI